MKKSAYIVILVLTVAGFRANAQQYNITSQYLTNGLVINPAYAGSRGAMSINASYRQQWVNITGAPQFMNLTLHSPINRKERVAMGFMLNHMSFGITRNTGVSTFYAYSVPVSGGRLSFGLKAGAEITNMSYSDVEVIDKPDYLFEGSSSYILPNFGAGAYYYSDNLFAGFSVPSLLSYHQSEKDNYTVSFDSKRAKMFFTAGGLITASPFLKIKPSFLIRYAIADPFEVDLNTTVYFADVLSVGGSYRMTEKALVAIIELQVIPQLRIGYSYDYQAGQLNNYTSGTHEISLRYEFEFKVSAASPRYF